MFTHTLFARDLKHIKDRQLFRRVQQVIEEIKAATALSDIQNLKKMQEPQTKQVEREMTHAAYVAAFIFTILQRVSPDMEPGDVIQLESSWKQRLHTRQPYGLNDN